MPFLPQNNFLLEEDKKKQEQQNNSSNLVSGDSGNTFTLGLPNGTNPTNKAQPKQSGSFTNLNKYLDANKEQASQMGSEIVNRVDSNATAAKQDIYNLGTEKQSVAQVNTNKYLQDPTKNTDDDIQSYQDLRSSGGYHGPNDISETKNYFNTQKAVSDASQMVNNAGTEEGRISLLQDQYKRPSYNRGSQILDQTLVQNNEDSRQKFNDVTNKFSNLNSLLDGTINEVGNSINTSKNQALTNKQAILDAESNAWNNLINPIQTRAAKQKVDNKDLISRITNDVSDDTLNEETLKLLGLGEGQKLYDMSLSNYLNPDYTEVGIDNAANADERARYLALQRLIQDPTRTELTADGKSINPLSFDKAKFDKDNAAKAQELADLFSRTSIGGDFSFAHQGGNIQGHAEANVADYLQRQAAAINATSVYSGDNSGGAFFDWNVLTPTQQGYADGRNGAIAAALANLEKYLTDQQYYRTVKKG